MVCGVNLEAERLLERLHLLGLGPLLRPPVRVDLDTAAGGIEPADAPEVALDVDGHRLAGRDPPELGAGTGEGDDGRLAADRSATA